ncbi:MAG: hypothetical protein ACYC27_21870 [Armatimonadota bacterium]
MDNSIRFDFDYAPEEMPVERDAKIFEAGDYPDKGITITEDDLDGIVERFTEVPVKVEHTDSPLDPLGLVKRVWRTGRELFGRLAFPRDIAAFLERRNIKRLSVSLLRDPLSLSEVSIVLCPRISTAEMFSSDESMGEYIDEEVSSMSEDQDMLNGSKSAREIRELKFALKCKDVDAHLIALKAQGKIVPASEAFAKDILLYGDGKVSFADDVTTISELFERFLNAQPQVAVFGEMSAAHRGNSAGPLSSEDEDLLRKLGVSREQVQRYSCD